MFMLLLRYGYAVRKARGLSEDKPDDVREHRVISHYSAETVVGGKIICSFQKPTYINAQRWLPRQPLKLL